MKSLLDNMINMLKSMFISNNKLKIEDFLALPINILETILAQYLGICDVSSLDIACCNHNNRQRLLTILSDSCIIFNNVTLSNVIGRDVDNAMRWFGLRRINIHHLSMIGNSTLTNTGLIGLSLHSYNLRSLYIGGVNNINDKGLMIFSKKSINLHTLYVRDSGNITDNGIIELVKNCKMLSSLYIAGSSITNNGMSCIAKGLPNLHTLNISDCINVSDIGIIELGKYCHQLDSLYCGGCDITDDGVIQLIKLCNNLTTLNINGCNKITETGVQALQKYTKNTVLSLYVGRK